MYLEFHHFATPNELTEISTNHQQLLTPQKKRDNYTLSD